MKGIKKVLSVVLAVALLMTSLVVTASASSFPDVDDNAGYASAVSVLSKLGIIKGYAEDGTFKPMNEVTRAEFTAMLMRVLNVAQEEQTVWADSPFTDLSDAAWAIGNIRTAYGMGIINGYGDGTFRPNDQVKYEEAIKMIVCALGYGANIANDGVTWYANFYAQAMTLGITNNVDGTLETNATRACIAQLIFNSLEVEIVENNALSGKTLLDYLGLIKNTGRISANEDTSLDSPDVNLASNQIEIYAKEEGSSDYTTNVYTTDDTSIRDLLGYQVTFYYNLDRATNQRELILAETKSPKELTIDANLLESSASTDSSIRYYQNLNSEKTSSASLANDNIVIYNGKLYGANAEASRFTKDMLPKIGSVRLVDSGSSGSYDMVFIESYVPYYVSSVSASSKTITDTLTRPASSTDKTVELDEDASDYTLSIVDDNGKAINFSSISKGDVVNVKESNADNGGTVLKTAVVTDAKASGSVTSINNDVIVVSGKSYDYSPYAPWEMYDSSTATLPAPSVGDSATYSLDINGNIFAYEKTATSTNISYGYIMAVSTRQVDSVDTLRFYMLTMSNRKEELTAHTTLKLNGKSYKTSSQMDDILNELAISASDQNKDSGAIGAQYTQLVKYETRSDGKISSIITADVVSQPTNVTTDSLSLYDAVGGVSMSCNSSKQLSGNGTTVSTSSAAVFVVPTDRQDFDSYKKSTSSEFKNGNSYVIDAYDLSSSRSAAAIVLYGKDASEAVDAETPVYQISEVYSTSVNGEPRMKVRGTMFKSGLSASTSNFDEVVSTRSEDLVGDLQEGDIVRFGSDTEGYLSLESKDILWSDGQRGYIEVDDSSSSVLSTDPYSAEFVAIYGSVLYADSGDDIVLTDELISGSYSGGEEYTIARSDFSSAKAFIYRLDNNGRISEIVEEGDSALDLLLPYSDGENADPSKVFVYMSKGRVKAIVIFEYAY